MVVILHRIVACISYDENVTVANALLQYNFLGLSEKEIVLFTKSVMSLIL